MDEGVAVAIGVRNPADPSCIIWVKFDKRIDLGANSWVKAIIGHGGDLHVATVPPGPRWARRHAGRAQCCDRNPIPQWFLLRR
jgi:hypothetical protein